MEINSQNAQHFYQYILPIHSPGLGFKATISYYLQVLHVRINRMIYQSKHLCETWICEKSIIDCLGKKLVEVKKENTLIDLYNTAVRSYNHHNYQEQPVELIKENQLASNEIKLKSLGINQILTELPSQYRVTIEDVKKDGVDFHGFNRLMKDSYLCEQLEQLTQQTDSNVVRLMIPPQEFSGIKKESYEHYTKDLFEDIETIINRKADYLLVPILSHGHYTGFLIDHKTHQLIHYNSKTHSNLTDWEKKVCDHLKSKFDYTYQTNQTCSQINEGWSCGYRLLHFFKQYSSGKPLENIDREEWKVEELCQSVNDYLLYLVQKQEQIDESGVIPYTLLENEFRGDFNEIVFQFIKNLNSLKNLEPAESDGSKSYEDKRFLNISLTTTLVFLHKHSLTEQFLAYTKEKIEAGQLCFTNNQKTILNQLLMSFQEDREELVHRFYLVYEKTFGEKLAYS